MEILDADGVLVNDGLDSALDIRLEMGNIEGQTSLIHTKDRRKMVFEQPVSLFLVTSRVVENIESKYLFVYHDIHNDLD